MRDDDIAYIPDAIAWLVDDGVAFRNARVNLASCSPSRASFLTGKPAHRHMFTRSGGAQGTTQYYDHSRDGVRVPFGWQGEAQWAGPIESQVTVARDGIDDPLYTSGNIYNWLKHDYTDLNNITDRAITTGLFGKYQTGFADSDATHLNDHLHDLEDIDVFTVLVGGWVDTRTPGNEIEFNGGVGDHWQYVIKRSSEVSYRKVRYNIPCSQAEVVDIGGGQRRITVTLDTADAYYESHEDWAYPLAIGDTVTLRSFHSTINGRQFTVETLPTDSTFTVLASSGTVGTYLVGDCFPEYLFQTNLIARDAAAFIAARDDDESFFMLVCPHTPHDGQTPFTHVTSDSHERSVVYEGTVASTEFMMWNGTGDPLGADPIPGAGPGAYSIPPTVDPAINPSGTPLQWRQRQEMMRSADDLVTTVKTALAARTDPFTGFTFADAGYQFMWADGALMNGEHGQLESKGKVWEESLSTPYYLRGPLLRDLHGTRRDEWVWIGDLALTILDWAGITDHFAHDNREGYSIMRKLGLIGSDEYPDRAIYCQTDESNGVDEVLYDADGYKVMTNASAVGSTGLSNQGLATGTYRLHRIFDGTFVDPFEEDAEDLSVSDPSRLAAMLARMALVKAAKGKNALVV